VEVRGTIPAGPFQFERQTWGGEGRWTTDASYRFHSVSAHGATFNLDAVGFFAEASEFTDCMFSQTPSVTKSNLKEYNHSLTTGLFGGNERSTYRGCTFHHMDFRSRGGGVDPGNATFEGCTFSYCAFNHFSPTHADFINCTFLGTITSAMFWGETPIRTPDPRRNAFIGNDLTGAKLRRVYFRKGVDLSTCRLPEGPEYLRVHRFLSKVNLVRAEIGTWPDKERKRAQVLLDYYEDDRQDLLFLWRGAVRDADRLLALLDRAEADKLK
jgi:uncharacterized protein YjbI with pentapeptide repeats